MSALRPDHLRVSRVQLVPKSARRREIGQNASVNPPDVFPGIGVVEEAPQEKQVRHHAVHPVDIGGVPENGATLRCQEVARELAARAPGEDAASRRPDCDRARVPARKLAPLEGRILRPVEQ